MAVENPNITAAVVEATEYPELVRRYRVAGVPKTVADDRIETVGSLPEAAFVRQALAGIADVRSQTQSADDSLNPCRNLVCVL